jgi:hypothetical protein
MISGSGTLVAVRRRQQPNLSKASAGLQQAPRSATPIVQMFLAELASLEQQVNALAIAKPTSIQPQAGPSQSVEPSKLRRLFD